MNARDIAIRTILGEAANESPMGQAAVAHVLMNRARDPRWPSTIQDVALQPKQFSAWNSGAGGNDLVRKYGPGSDPYERVGAIYDQVSSGQIADPTGGATHYYSPAGMRALVNQGAQSNVLPAWLTAENQRRGGNPTQIGGHIFTGLAEGAPVPIASAPTSDMALPEWLFEEAAREVAQQAPEAPQQPLQITPNMAQPYTPEKRDAAKNYRQFFAEVLNG